MREPLDRTQNPPLEDNPLNSSYGAERHRSGARRIALLLFLAILLGCAGIYTAIELRPSIGAGLAGRARDLFGPSAVARVEGVFFRLQDALNRWQYASGARQAEAPWETSGSPVGLTPSPQASRIEAVLPSESEPPAPGAPAATETPLPGEQGTPQEQFQEETASPRPTPTPSVWQLSDLVPFGSLEGEGRWQPYLTDSAGNVVAARTFLQPDPERPYTVVAVVAFDLNRTRLHFKLGFNEPAAPDGPRGDGLIPGEYRQEGVLLAAFNGGFRAANGSFGAMSDGITALPPRDELATIGIYRDGELRIGDWGEEITDSPDLLAWRQNARLILQDGGVSPRVYNDSITDWGASISNQIVTRRSGIGLDRQAKTLYYFAGPSLSMPALADAMLAAGVHDGMLLDINHFWVHFTAIRFADGQPVAEPLLPDDMIDQVDRYLGPSPADFFYITAREDEGP
jgi:hypothetical protein